MPNDDTLPNDTRHRAGFDKERARQLAQHPVRPGEQCGADRERYEPHIDRRRCEGKSDCLAVCPYDVFEVQRITPSDYSALPLLARLKSLLHRRRTAYAVRAPDCRACGLCVVACPEKAITLERTSGRLRESE